MCMSSSVWRNVCNRMTYVLHLANIRSCLGHDVFLNACWINRWPSILEGEKGDQLSFFYQEFRTEILIHRASTMGFFCFCFFFLEGFTEVDVWRWLTKKALDWIFMDLYPKLLSVCYLIFQAKQSIYSCLPEAQGDHVIWLHSHDLLVAGLGL